MHESPKRELPVNPYHLIVESVRDYALLLLDAEGYVTSWNPGAEAIKSYRADEIIGQHFSIFYPLQDRTTKPARELEIASTVGRFEEEGWRVRKDGSRFWANVVLTPVKNDAGTVIGFAKVTRDLTERQRAEEERARHQQAIRALSMPVIRLWPGILLLPLVGELDSRRAEQMLEQVLQRAVAEQAKVVVIDVAGIPTIDSYVADALLKTTSALRLLGSQAVVTGLGPSASRAIVRLGVDLSQMTTQGQLAGGLEIALSRLGKRVVDS